MNAPGGEKKARFLVTVSNCQAIESLAPGTTGELEKLGTAVLHGISERGWARRPLPRAVEVSLVDDEAIGRVHGEFMGDPGATDVITFPYGEFGEILISLETAARQGPEYGRSVEEERALYLIHGLLHLAGFTDETAPAREEMAKIQEELLTQYL